MNASPLFALLLLCAPGASAQEGFGGSTPPANAKDYAKKAKAEEPELYKAIRAGDLGTVKKLTTRENVNLQIQPPRFQDTPLSFAAMIGQFEIAKYLVEELHADISVSYKAEALSSDIAAQPALMDIKNPKHQELAAWLMPRYPFYKDYIAKIRSAGAYTPGGIPWPGEKTRYFMVGERHGIAEFPDAIIKLIESMPITHLATEFLGQREQDLIDRYQSDAITEEEFRTQCSHSDLVPVFAAAKRKGVKIVGLEKGPNYKDYDEAVKGHLTEERNYLWMPALLGIVEKNPDAKVLVYCGALHSNYGLKSRPISELAADKLGADAVFVAQLTGGTDRFKGGPANWDIPTYMVEAAGRAGDDLAIYAAPGDSAPLKAALAADLILHVKHPPLLGTK